MRRKSLLVASLFACAALLAFSAGPLGVAAEQPTDEIEGIEISTGFIVGNVRYGAQFVGKTGLIKFSGTLSHQQLIPRITGTLVVESLSP